MADVEEILYTRCPRCHRFNTLQVSTTGYAAWKAGALIQEALPLLTPSEREALKTGICNKCWINSLRSK